MATDSIEDLNRFMASIRRLESGSYQGDYGAVFQGDRHPLYGIAQGAYQIMSEIWPGWAQEAGVAGANWRDPVAQDRVARFKISQYFAQFGSWDLVAIAWFAGPGTARRAARNGIESITETDANKTTVPGYVQTIRGYFEDAPGQKVSVAEQGFGGFDFNTLMKGIDKTFGDPADTMTEPSNPDREIGLRDIIDSASAAIAGGERTPLDPLKREDLGVRPLDQFAEDPPEDPVEEKAGGLL